MEQNPQSIAFGLPGEPESAISTLAFAWRRKGLVFIAVIAATALGYLYFCQKAPEYESRAQILIVDQQPRILSEGLEIRDSSAGVHVALMQSQAVISSAVNESGLDQLATLRGSSHPAASVMAGLSVELAVGGETTTNGAIVELAYESPNPTDCPKVLQAIITAYEKFLSEMYDDVSQETIGLIAEAKNQLEREISETEAALRKTLADSPLLVTGETAENFHETRLHKIESILSDAVLENSKIRAKIDALQAAATGGLSRETLNLVVGHIETKDIKNLTGEEIEGRARRALNDRLFPLLVEEQTLLENHGPEHPSVKTVRKQIELTRQYHQQLVASDSRRDANDGEPPREFFDVYLDSLKEQIKINDQTMTEMNALFDKERLAAQGMSVHKIKEDTYRSEIERKTRFFDVVLKRLEEISLIKDRGGLEVRVIHPPGAEAQTVPDFVTVMAISIATGLVCGFGLAYIVDIADRRFRSPDEIRNDLGVPVVGHIPVIPNADQRENVPEGYEGKIGAAVRTVHAPRGRIAEAYRAVRTAIYFSTRGGGHQVIQVTSPNPGDGKTTLAANLAVSIANSGKRVLVIDADFRRPRCHSIFGAENKVGMSAVIEGTAELADAVQDTEVENLSILACGKRPKNPAELLTSRRFEELLDVLRAQYELVIVDTPPVLAVTDPLNVAPRVDGVLLVLKLSKTARQAGQRTLDSLEEVGANVLGVVVNGVGGGSKYGGYGYGQGYAYGYSYGRKYGYGGYGGYSDRYNSPYGYRDSDDQTYYTDDASDETEKQRPAANLHDSNGNGKH